MLSLEAQKQKSPQTVDVIEELLWTERTKKKEFYLDVKRSLLNLLEFSKTKLDLDSIGEIYCTVADIACFGKYFKSFFLFFAFTKPKISSTTNKSKTITITLSLSFLFSPHNLYLSMFMMSDHDE